jgi:hypothetical protein
LYLLPSDEFKIKFHYKIRTLLSLFVIVSIGEKTIEKGYADEGTDDDNVCDAFRVQHMFVQGIYRFHKKSC